MTNKPEININLPLYSGNDAIVLKEDIRAKLGYADKMYWVDDQTGTISFEIFPDQTTQDYLQAAEALVLKAVVLLGIPRNMITTEVSSSYDEEEPHLIMKIQAFLLKDEFVWKYTKEEVRTAVLKKDQEASFKALNSLFSDDVKGLLLGIYTNKNTFTAQEIDLMLHPVAYQQDAIKCLKDGVSFYVSHFRRWVAADELKHWLNSLLAK